MNIGKANAVIDRYERLMEQLAAELVAALKEDRPTYHEIDEALSHLRQSLQWSGRQSCLPIIDAADKMLDDEKGRLFAASGPSR